MHQTVIIKQGQVETLTTQRVGSIAVVQGRVAVSGEPVEAGPWHDVPPGDDVEVIGLAVSSRIHYRSERAEPDQPDAETGEPTEEREKTLAELRKEASAIGIKGYSKLRKAELAKAVDDAA